MKTVYLDNCCLNRPFDDQSQPRIRLEAEAVTLILELVQRKKLALTISDASITENNRCRDDEKRRQVACLMQLSGRRLKLDAAVITRAEQFSISGFGVFDALHLAFAEKAGVDVILTTDDRMLALARRRGTSLNVRVENPVAWIQEQGRTA